MSDVGTTQYPTNVEARQVVLSSGGIDVVSVFFYSTGELVVLRTVAFAPAAGILRKKLTFEDYESLGKSLLEYAERMKRQGGV